MMYLYDFLMYLFDGMLKVFDYVSIIASGIGECFGSLFEMVSNFPLWLTVPIFAMLVLAIIFQIISFIPTESGGH